MLSLFCFVSADDLAVSVTLLHVGATSINHTVVEDYSECGQYRNCHDYSYYCHLTLCFIVY